MNALIVLYTLQTPSLDPDRSGEMVSTDSYQVFTDLHTAAALAEALYQHLLTRDDVSSASKSLVLNSTEAVYLNIE